MVVPQCRKVMEMTCRNILEQLYKNHKFESIRPCWLKSMRTHKNLELDCYNHELLIALEYNGQQHYSFPNVWHKHVSEFEKTVAHDAYKKDVCKKLGVFLLCVPYTIHKSNLKKYIYDNLMYANRNGMVKNKPKW